ncbi:Methionyl-tRNA formyltransferase [subsurface metagenome]
MRIAFFGATKLGCKCCRRLIEKAGDVIGIFTIPRKFSISYSKDKPVENVLYEDFHRLAGKYGIPVVEIVTRMSCSEYIEVLKKWQPDLILVIGWYYLIPRVIRNIASLGCIGVHASLLPKYAGGAPLVWAIIKGERETGVSLFYIKDGVDTGDLIAQEKVDIKLKDTIATLYARVECVTLKMIEEYIPKIEREIAPCVKQDLSLRTVFSQRKPEDGLINWNQPSLDVYNFIRAQTLPYPGAFTFRKGKKLIVWEGKFYDFMKLRGEPGQVLDIIESEVARGFLVATGNYDIPLLLTKVGTEEVNLMEAIDYARRENLRKGEIILGKT